MTKRRRGGRDGPRSDAPRGAKGHAQKERPHQVFQEQRLNVPHQELEQRPHQEQRLCIIFDDHPLGYSIREISLSPLSPRQTRSSRMNTAASGKVAVRRLPDPILCVEAVRGIPSLAAVGTRILLMQGIDFPIGGCSNDLMHIVDVRSRVVRFGPGVSVCTIPICIPVGAELFVLDWGIVRKLSFNTDWPPEPDDRISRHLVPWSWHALPLPEFDILDVASYAVHSDGHTIVFSTDIFPGKDDAFRATFSFDTRALEWKKHGDWKLPFTGRGYFVHRLSAYVGLSKEPDSLGHLAYCEAATRPAESKFGKEKLFSDDPAETHVSATLLYMEGRGGGSEFCLVQCVSVVEHGNGNAEENVEEPRPSCWYRYRLTTFSLSYDNNGDLTTGKTSRVQCYEVPRETSERFISSGDPTAFWM